MINKLKLPGLIALVIILVGFVQLEKAHAQYFSFGKNQVQYKNFNWKYIQSAHFDVYYYQDKNYYLAVFAAQTLEASLKQIEQDFNYRITQRIKVIVYDSHNDFAETNVTQLPLENQGIGGVTEPYKNRITLPFMGDYSDFRHTIHHELIHAVVNEMFYGGSVQSIIQNNIQLQIPGWFNEGMAEYSSMGFDTQEDDFLRDAILNNYMPPISQLNGFFDYRGGQSIWNYIVEEYGREKIAEIFHDIKNSRNVEQGFKQALGLSIEELSKRWHTYLKKRYLPEIADRQALSDVGTQITKRGKLGSFNTSPAISPQGDRIAMITNQHGYFDVVIVNAITGEKIKTLVKGQTNVAFEELNIENYTTPNLTWSPDGTKLALSVESKGVDELAIVNVNTGVAKKYRFPSVDAINSVTWSPDGKKLAFAGTTGPYADIFVYNMETNKLVNVTHDIFTDKEPAWGSDSKTIYFVSDRGSKVDLNKYKIEYDELLNPNLEQTDLYSVKIGDSRCVRLTKTPGWNETRPQVTRSGQLVYISDKNGIPNAYEMNLRNRTSQPLTNLLSGILQMSLNADGSKMAISAFNGGYVDIYLIKDPLGKKISKPLEPNYWAKRRAREPEDVRVPARLYAFQMFGGKKGLAENAVVKTDTTQNVISPTELASLQGGVSSSIVAKPDSTKPDSAKVDSTKKQNNNDIIDYHNYVFGKEYEKEIEKNPEANVFKPEDNLTKNNMYVPHKYKLSFAPDFTYYQGNLSTYYGTYGLVQMLFSDVLGDQQISFASNLVFDLRNSDYIISYANYKHRTNYQVYYTHTAQQYATYSGYGLGLVRYRMYGGGINFSYPFNKFTRIDYGATMQVISRDVSDTYYNNQVTATSSFLYPQVTFTKDLTKPGFLTPSGGYRYAVSLTASPPITNKTARFVSLLGDFRKYIGLGYGYSFALRYSGGISFGRDAQNFFIGGMDGWINYRWSNNQIPLNNLSDIFLTLPAIPMRGFEYNAMYGDRFSLVNLEFRFPLFAAILPGPIPILPLYNMTGEMFTDIGTAWNGNGLFRNNNFRIAKPTVNPQTGQQGFNGKILIGSGFGIRTILLGLPFRWDIGWPYDGKHFGHPINYISIGLDF